MAADEDRGDDGQQSPVIPTSEPIEMNGMAVVLEFYETIPLDPGTPESIRINQEGGVGEFRIVPVGGDRGTRSTA